MSNLFKKLNNQMEVSNVKSKAITEQEMKEVGIEVKGNDEWLEYVLGHVFDEVGLPEAVYNAIMSGDVQSIIFKTKESDVVKVTLSK